MNRRNRAPWSKTEKWAIGATTVPCLLAAALGGYNWWVNLYPANPASLPPAPSPNAYDYYLKAKALYHPPAHPYFKRNHPQIGGALQSGLLPADLAVDMCYQYGLKNWPYGFQPRYLSTTYSHWYPASQKASFLTQNADCLAMLRAGSAFPYQPPPLPLDDEVGPSPIAQGERCSLFDTQARYYAQQGQWDRGAQCLVDLDKVGLNICSGGIEQDWWDGPTLRIDAMAQLSGFVEHVSLGECRALLREFQKARPGQATVAATMARDENWKLDQLFRAMAANTVPQMLKTQYGTSDAELDPNFEWSNKRAVYAQAKRVLDWKTMKVKSSILTWRTGWPFTQELKHSPLKHMLDGDLRTVQLFEEETETHQALLVTMLAQRLYKTANGHYPATLQKLVPRYVKAVPVDVYNNLKPLRYAPHPNHFSWRNPGAKDGRERFDFPERHAPSEWDDVEVPYTLYSLAQDRTDDGGNSKSDLVATQYGLAPSEQMGGG